MAGKENGIKAELKNILGWLKKIDERIEHLTDRMLENDKKTAILEQGLSMLDHTTAKLRATLEEHVKSENKTKIELYEKKEAWSRKKILTYGTIVLTILGSVLIIGIKWVVEAALHGG